MTVLDDNQTLRPEAPVFTRSASTHGNRSIGNRLAARLAWREVRRRKGRTALVVLLIAAPTMALVLASTVARTEMKSSTLWGQRGAADVVVNSPVPWSDQPAELTALPPGATTVSYLKTGVPIEPTTPIDTPFLNQVYVGLTNLPVDSLDTMGMIEVRSGTAPRPGELLLSEDVAEQLGVGVGDDLTLARPSGTWTVSGIGRYAHNYHESLLLIPEFDPARLQPGNQGYETLIFMPVDATEDQVKEVARSTGGYAPGHDLGYDGEVPETGELALGWLIAAMAFMAFGIVVAAAFATSAGGQLVTVGQLSANGAPTRLIRRVLAWQGMWSGAIGAVVGSVLGLIALPILHGPAQEYFFGRSVDWVIAPFDIVIVAITATVAGLVAAAVPAHSLSTTSVLSALAGRRPARDVPRWMAPLGVLLLCGGTGLMVLSLMAMQSTNGDSVALTGATLLGGVGLALGTCCLSPTIVAMFARFAGNLPLAGRMSLRGMARSRGRTAAVISAVAVTVGIAVAAVSVTERELDANAAPSISPLDILTLRSGDTRYQQVYDDFVAETGTDVGGEITEPPPTSFRLAELEDSVVPSAALDRIAEIFPNASIEPLQAAVHPGGQVELSADADPWMATSFSIPIASEATFAAGDWPPEARDLVATEGFAGVVHPMAGNVILLGADGSDLTATTYTETLHLTEFGIDGAPVVESYDTLPYGSEFSYLMTEKFAREHGLAIVDNGVIIDNRTPITRDQRDELGSIWPLLNGDQTAWSPFIEPGDTADEISEAADGGQFVPEPTWSMSYEYVDFAAMRNLWITRFVALGAALLLVGIVVAIGLALAAADNKAERDVLAIVGARPSSLRRMAASNAFTMTLIGIAVGIPVGFLPTWAVVRAVSREQTGVPFPSVFAIALVVVLPAAMMLMAWTASAVSARLVHARITRLPRTND